MGVFGRTFSCKALKGQGSKVPVAGASAGPSTMASFRWRRKIFILVDVLEKETGTGNGEGPE